jgi:hypothetical protein
MNEIRMIELLDDSRQPSSEAMQAAFARLAAEFDRPAAQQQTRRPDAARPMRARRRLGSVAAVAAGSAAAVLVAGAVLTNGLGGGQSAPQIHGRPTQAPTALTTAAPPPTDPTQPPTTSMYPAPTTLSDPAQVLTAAAGTQRLIVEPTPRPDQFLYITDSGGGYEAWLSIDGSRDGLVLSAGQTIYTAGCVDGLASDTQRPCIPQPAFRPDAPTTAAEMAAYIVAEATSGNPTLGNQTPPNANAIGKTLLSLIRNAYLLPEAKAALFEAVPLLPGLSLTTAFVDGSSGALTAVSWSFGASTNALLFDTLSHAYVGFTDDSVPAQSPAPSAFPNTTAAPPAGPTGHIQYVRQAIVDEAGARN